MVCADARLLRTGLVALLSQPADIEVVVQVNSSRLIVPMAIVMRPNVAVIDVDMPDGPAAVDQLFDAVPGCRALALTSRRGDRASVPVAGRARGTISKAASPDFIVAAVRQVAEGDRVTDPDVTGEVTRVTDSPLTRRETDVLREAAEGLSTSEIAERLGLSPGTVRNYISRAIAKTGTHRRVDAVRLAAHNGWIRSLK